jgi:hypothetical protein
MSRTVQRLRAVFNTLAASKWAVFREICRRALDIWQKCIFGDGKGNVIALGERERLFNSASHRARIVETRHRESKDVCVTI